MPLYTIGHSNHSPEAFLALLQQHGITALADVRSHPYSRYLPHFSQSTLKALLVDAGIRYVFLGKELGARPQDPDCYDHQGKATYEKIAATSLFQQGLERLLEGTQTHAIALMCAEKDPLNCHRAILVCQHLRSHQPNIQHILSDGSLEPHATLETRLLQKHKLLPKPEPAESQLSLFADLSEASDLSAGSTDEATSTSEAALQIAYRLQGAAIAYVETPEASDG
ncbi:MAG: hypothetical protein Fur0046_33250 [Cyanobacteria bacterium J069]|nr:MAG: DUF488 domain-containing protein [Cyanobacteria bacterium J069]